MSTSLHKAKMLSVACTCLLLLACGGGGGNSGTQSPTPTPVVDSTSPVLSFSPASLTVASGGTGTSTLSASDNIGVVSGPTVQCTNGGSFNVGSNTFTAPNTATGITSVCTATAQDAAGNAGTSTLSVTVTASSPTVNVAISGKITFDSVPFNASSIGLDYNNISRQPARGVTVQAVDSSGTVLDTDVTDENGDYSVDVDSNTNLRIQVRAEMVQSTGATWDVRVVDNTSSGALYVLQGSLSSSGNASSVRNLNAASGWGGSSYTSGRAAAPFAILSPIYDALTKIEAVDPDVVFPSATFNWSTNNRPSNGQIANGDIGTSFYGGNGQIFILGAANTDTDEYDSHIIVHEWGHYFEDQLSRSDSIGGQHTGNDRLDPRVAMGEGFGNALSGMIMDDPFYRDSLQASQASGFFINVEDNNATNEGWFNETSVQSILYDLYDATDDGADSITLGLAPIYETFRSQDYIGMSVFTTIFAYIDEFKTISPGNNAAIDALMTAQNINGTGKIGIGETNNGGIPISLPVYKELQVNGAPVQICFVPDAGDSNKLGNIQYLRFTVAGAGNHTLTMALDPANSTSATGNADFSVFKDGVLRLRGNGSTGNNDTSTGNLAAGEHVIDARDLQIGSGSGNTCFNFTITG